MGYLNDSVPADSEAVKLGASRIRALQTQLNAVISQIFSDAGTFLPKWITTSMIQDGAVTSTQIADASVTTSKLASRSVTNDKLAAGAAGGVQIFDSSGNPTSLAPGTAGTVLTSNGTTVSFGAAPAKGVPHFINPVSIASLAVPVAGSFAAAGWHTASTLASYGVPVDASAVILFHTIFGSNTIVDNGFRAASGSAEVLSGFAGNTAGVVSGSGQGLYAFNNNSGVLSVDYSAYATASGATLNVYLVGWIS
jgi:hypothetical protein